uniref:Barrier-to-autointegration factor n=1 Tax=Oncorhynchus tshawytscha TaxID=74940 RepID=A0A8C8BV52_ONCTS
CRNVDRFSGDFVAEPMSDKLLLKDTGGAFVVLGQFLLLRKDGELFAEWLKVTSGANTRNAASCSQCLNEWCDVFL